jgi:acetylornithine/succinyldiaminopimelate/putrescine aminotransferase
MNTLRQLFFQHIGQTSQNPMSLEINKAEGIYLFDNEGKKYIDFISGISVSNIGHSNPLIIKAIKEQAEKHLHLMVYGEYIQAPQVEYASLLTKNLPENLESVYFVNSGSEANEGAIKLAKRFTGRTEIISFKNAYHGSTQALLGLMDNTYYTQAFRPLMPDIRILEFNNFEDLDQISERTACVIVEPIQGEAGIVLPENDFLKHLRKRCHQKGSLLIFDEIQTGFGRTGQLFAFQKYGVSPDILTIAKAMGGGMPLGAFVSSKKIMQVLMDNPVLGHITTFGGHPVSCAAALAHLKILLQGDILNQVDRKGEYLVSLLQHELIINVRGTGLFYAIELQNPLMVKKFLKIALELGVIADWFLHCDYRVRIAPPLIINFEELKLAAQLIIKALDLVIKEH